jgi:hypothetical protein
MSTLTKEWLQQTIAELEEEGNATPGAVNEGAANALAAMKLALASLEAEAVYQVLTGDSWVDLSKGAMESQKRVGAIVRTVYTAPPAPVSDSLLSELLGIAKRAAYEADECAHAEFSDDSMEHSAAIVDWERRAAMLQGAEPVSNRDELPLDYLQGQKDGLEWAAQLAEANHPQTGDWLYDDPIELAKAIRKGPDMPESRCGNSPVIPDGYALVPVEPTAEMLQSGISAHYERNQIQIHDRPAPGPMECAYVAMLAAAPQQKVTQALTKGMERYGDAMQKFADGGD